MHLKFRGLHVQVHKGWSLFSSHVMGIAGSSLMSHVLAHSSFIKHLLGSSNFMNHLVPTRSIIFFWRRKVQVHSHGGLNRMVWSACVSVVCLVLGGDDYIIYFKF